MNRFYCSKQSHEHTHTVSSMSLYFALELKGEILVWDWSPSTTDYNKSTSSYMCNCRFVVTNNDCMCCGAECSFKLVPTGGERKSELCQHINTGSCGKIHFFHLFSQDKWTRRHSKHRWWVCSFLKPCSFCFEFKPAPLVSICSSVITLILLQLYQRSVEFGVGGSRCNFTFSDNQETRTENCV